MAGIARVERWRKIALRPHELEFRLLDPRVPDGQISFRDLAALAHGLQELSLRIGRSMVEAEGPGRTNRTIEELSELRLRGIEDGSTRLLVAQGPSDVLDLDLPQTSEIERRFWDVISAIGQDTRPDWVSDLIAESAATVVRALQAAAPEVVVSRADQSLRIRSTQIHRETWAKERVSGDDTVAVVGMLEKVDLRSHDFRVRDDAGNAIELKGVRSDSNVGRLVGSHVTAVGVPVFRRSGRVSALSEPVITEASTALDEFRIPANVPLDDILASAPGPDPDGGIELTDDEFAAFLEATQS